MSSQQTEISAYSVKLFCSTHCITPPTFYELLKTGQAPRTMLVRGRRLISKEAAEEWRKKMEDDTEDNHIKIS